MTLTEKLNRLPPCIVRILAKHNGKLITDPELMRRTGWGKRYLRSVYNSASWDGIKVGDVDKFLAACGMSWSTQRRQRWLIQLGYHKTGSVIDGIKSMQHLQNDVGWRGNQLRLHLNRIERLLA